MAEPHKCCLYEILGVPFDSSPDEIRSAYRKLALKLHPDKLAAAANPPSAAASFHELAHAYDVLSDPKERQFYDSHRSQILFSNPSNPKSKSPSSFFNDLDLLPFFSNSAFSGFSDTTRKGFFKVYGDVFGKIYSKELFFVDQLGLDPGSVPPPPPPIGNLDSDSSQVASFYNYWLGFATVMDFGWADEFDVLAEVNPRSRHAMEEENEKKRRKARREYNAMVRDLAAFAKKRDKRVKDMHAKKALEEERRKMEAAKMYEEPEWARIDNDDNDDEPTVHNETEKEEFYCVACNKKFKSEKQWKNHEQSKKHREKVAEFRVSFQDGNVVVDELCDFGFKKVRVPEESDKELVSDDDEASILETMVSGREDKMSDEKSKNDKKSEASDGFSRGDLPLVAVVATVVAAAAVAMVAAETTELACPWVVVAAVVMNKMTCWMTSRMTMMTTSPMTMRTSEAGKFLAAT